MEKTSSQDSNSCYVGGNSSTSGGFIWSNIPSDPVQENKIISSLSLKKASLCISAGPVLFMGQVDGLTLGTKKQKMLNSWELIWQQSGGQTRQHNSLSFAICLRCQPRTGTSPSINLTHTHTARPHNLPHRPASLVSLSISPFRCECASVCVCVCESGLGSRTRPCGVFADTDSDKAGERRRSSKRRLYSSLCDFFFLPLFSVCI